ncbi:hypothetical protein GOBAR_AA20603 [Gossypium barbadense]|uniref:HMA domain-containing protein n=1 Tax=Gossypium barbadense TaxID=3634 RepID=A0A2P5X9N4_GOSBA|nr:hypothetical protein GOBAR_AA20603 [Gossypium barbadense]
MKINEGYSGVKEGVETVKTESNSNKVTVTGAVDPTAIKENIVKKSKKKVDVIAPQPKKDDNKEDKKEKKPEKDKNQPSDNSKQEKKPKEAPLTTADLKVQLKCQCQGCILKIRKIVSETKGGDFITGVQELKVDTQKELVTVKGTMDVKALAEVLKDKLKKNVEIVLPKKEKDGNKENGGNEVNAVPSGGGGAKVEGNRMEFMVQPEYGYGYMPGYPGYMPSYPGYGYPGYGYGYGHPHPHGHGHCYPAYVPNYPVFVHPPHQMFNDENPNACAIL